MSNTEQNGLSSPSPDEIAKQQRIREAVRTIQSKLPVSPVPKPRRFSPGPSPPRPRKPPYQPPERARILLQGVHVTPPDSPMRGRSENFKTTHPEERPKPPVRRRKKKFITDESQEGTNRSSIEVGTDKNSVDGDFVNVSIGPGVEEGEGVVVADVTEEECKGDGRLERKEDKVEGEMSNANLDELQRERFESFVLVGGENDRLTTVASPDVSVTCDEDGTSGRSSGASEGDRVSSNQSPSLDRRSQLSPEVVPSLSGSSPDISSPVTDTSEQGKSSPTLQARAGLQSSTPLAQSGKKKPPPLPPPYIRPPPIPAKQRTVRHNLTNSVVSEGNGPVVTVTDSTTTTPTTSITTAITTAPPPTDTKQLPLERNNLRAPKTPTRPPSPRRSLKVIPSTREKGQSPCPQPINEEVESSGASSGGSGGSLTPMNSVEMRKLTSRPDSTPKPAIYGSSDSLEMSGGSSPNTRHSTIGVSNRIKAKNRSLPSSKTSSKERRPLSDASLSLLDGYDVVLPAGHLQDMMKSVICNDEKMQEANIYEVVQACTKAMPHVTSTRELPSQISGMPTDKRSNVIHELYTTEYTYVQSLETLSEVFKDPLAAALGEESGRIFANVDDILAFNKGFLALLNSRLSSWQPDSLLGDLFIGMFTQSHRSMYAIYCSNYDSAEAQLQLKRKKKEFEQQLSVCRQSARVIPGLTLAAYLITPVQRIPRYILLLKDIIERTPDNHPDYKNLQTALETMGELANYIDAQIRESQTKRTFDTLKNKVVGLADLESADRSLVKEGQCYLKNIKKLYQCILFNDQLVFAHGDSRQSKVQLQLPLEAVWVEDLEDLDPQTSNQDAIEVYTPDRPYTIYTRTSAEKKLWLSKLRETIYQLLLKDGKCTRSSSLDTTQRTATFLYADGRLYTGNYTAARRHGKGSMLWPDQSKYIGDWVDDERHGEGQFAFCTREEYDGKWVEDRISGYGTMTFASADKYIGYWRDGIRHGKGKIIYSNGDIFEGHFSNGQIDGRGRLVCRNGLEYFGHWKHSQRHGQGKLRTILGNVYEGEFQRNQIQGRGRMVYRIGDVYDGPWKGGMRHGLGKFTSKREGVYEGSWFNDLRHGKGRQEYPNKDIYDGSWEQNMRHGKGVLEFASGDRYRGDFSYDMISGEGEMTYVDDSRYNGQWMNGLYHGQGVMVYHYGTPMMSTFSGDWRYGLRHGQGDMVMFDGTVYRGLWESDKPHGKGNYSVPTANYYYTGDWVEGKKEGRGEETSQLGGYKGQWKNDQKDGSGEEKTLVGTTFIGHWERNKKHGGGVRKTVTGTVEHQEWHVGTQVNDPHRRTTADLPQLPRLDY